MMPNPYFGNHLGDFFLTLIYRLPKIMGGNVELALDELQLLVLICVGISSSLVGCFLVLRRMTMLANALSHTILLGIAITYVLTFQEGSEEGVRMGDLFVAALVTGMLTTFLTEFLSRVMGLQEDASTGLVFTSLFALGIVVVTAWSRNAHIGAEVVMGNADALHPKDLTMVAWIMVGNLLLFALLFKEYQLTTFDGSLAKAVGVSVGIYNYLLMAQVSATAIGAFRAVGVLMVLALMIGPALTARLLTHRLKGMLLWSCGVAVSSALLGVALSRHMLSVYHTPLSTAGLTVCVITGLFLVALLFSREQGVVTHWLRLRRGD